MILSGAWLLHAKPTNFPGSRRSPSKSNRKRFNAWEIFLQRKCSPISYLATPQAGSTPTILLPRVARQPGHGRFMGYRVSTPHQSSLYGEAMDCWSMPLCFLTRQILTSSAAFASARQIQLNPFPGVSREILRILTHTEMLIFRFRNRESPNRFASKKYLDFLFDCSREVRSIERWLVTYPLPKTADTFDPGHSKRDLLSTLFIWMK